MSRRRKKRHIHRSAARMLVISGAVILAVAFGFYALINQFSPDRQAGDVSALVVAIGFVLAGLCWIAAFSRKA